MFTDRSDSRIAYLGCGLVPVILTALCFLSCQTHPQLGGRTGRELTIVVLGARG